MTETQTVPTAAECLAAAQATVTLMTATRLAAGMTPDDAVRSTFAAFMAMCEAQS